MSQPPEKNDTKMTGKQIAAAARAERLRQQLRANLQRRKEQARGRKETPANDDMPGNDGA